jgi:hypothetical protein
MNELEARLLRRLLDDPERLSRNRNFHSYQDAAVRRTARLSRVLRSLRDDLLRDDLGEIAVREHAEGGQLVVELGWPGRSRTTFVTEDELAALLEDDDVARVLGPHLLRAAS